MMKIKKAAQLAVIGIILNILPVVLNSFIPFNKIYLISNSMRITGNILLVIFFFVFIVRQQEISSLRVAGVLGLIGYLIIVILNMKVIISNSIIIIALKDPLKYVGLMNIASILSRVDYLIGLIPTLLLLICFMNFHKNFNKKGYLRKATFFAFIGQLILLTEWIVNFILNTLLFKILYQKISPRGLSIISTVESIIELIPLILLAVFFIVLYREFNNNKNRHLFVVET
jgi:hypothetical protein